MLGEALTGEAIDFDRGHVALPVGMQRRSAAVLAAGGRLLSSHERHHRRCRRVIYLARNPASVAPSYHRYMEWATGMEMPLERFAGLMAAGEIGPYGSWQDHVDWWLADPPAQVHVLRYEDLLDDPAARLATALRFLGAEPDAGRIEDAVRGNTLPRMREKLERARLPGLRMPGREVLVQPAGDGERERLGPEAARRLAAASAEGMRRLGYA